jgi:fucose 4-O-acetylase-like acetyltransferase
MVLDKYLHRDDSIAIAKALGIILVVIGHSTYNAGYQDEVKKFIYMFHMPLFFILSGYFFKMKYVNEKMSFVKKKIRGLYLPYIEWLIAFILLHNFFCVINVYNDSILDWGASYYSIHDMLCRFKFTLLMDFGGGCERLLGGFWFIPVLFASSLMCLFALYFIKLTHRLEQMAIVVFLMILFLFLSMASAYFNISISLVDPKSLLASTMFLSGFLANRYNLFRMDLNRYAFLSFIVLIAVFSQIHYVCIGGGWKWYDAPYLVFFGFIGTWMIVDVAKLLLRTRLKTILIYIGENTMIILALHFLCFKLVNLAKITYYGANINLVSSIPIYYDSQSHHNLLWWMLYISIGVLFPIGIKYLYDYCKFKFVGIKNK